MTQGCPAFTPNTIHIKLSSNVQTAGQARSAWSHEENSPVPFDALSLAHAGAQFDDKYLWN
jgi:hypothetical protein